MKKNQVSDYFKKRLDAVKKDGFCYKKMIKISYPSTITEGEELGFLYHKNYILILGFPNKTTTKIINTPVS